MYVCICHKVTDRDIESAVRSGCCNLRSVQKLTALGTQCGSCCELAKDIITECVGEISTLDQIGLPS